MSVLPQLERELSAAHARRRRRRMPLFTGAPVALAAAVAVAVVVVAVIALRSGPSPQHPAGAAAIVYRGFLAHPYAAGGSLYGVATDRPDSPTTTGASKLVRIDPGSGRVVAARPLTPPTISAPGGGHEQPDPVPQHMLLSAGSLWVTASDSHRSWLWRFDPHSLAVRSLTLLPGGGAGNTGSLAVAGGWMWVVNVNTLVRVSLRTGQLAGSRTFSRAELGQGNSIAADSSGDTLIAAVARRIGFRVFRLDPHTGAQIAESATFPGSTPQLVGVLDGGAWINGFTAVGSPARVDLRTLKVTAQPRGFPAWVQVLGQTVQLAGKGGLRCVDPVTGATLATEPVVVAAENTTAYVQVTRRGIPEIHRETLDPRCLAHR